MRDAILCTCVQTDQVTPSDDAYEQQRIWPHTLIDMNETAPKPIRKNQRYYSTTDNMWNNPYLTSPKIARYYHKPNQSYIENQSRPPSSPSHPSNPVNTHRAQSLLRHRIRREERLAVPSIQLEAKCRGQSPFRSSPESSRIWTATQVAMNPQVPGNDWQRIDALPRRKLTQFITKKCLEMDECRK